MKNRYRTMMEQISLSDRFQQNMEDTLHSYEGKHHRAFLRPVLAASCLCIALVGTAFAAKTLTPEKVDVVSQTSGKDAASYSIRASLSTRSPASLSNEVQAELAAGTLQQTFTDKASLETYLGFSLVKSQTLESAGIVETLSRHFEYGWTLMPELAIDTSARYILTAPDAEALKISGHRVIHNTEIYLTAYIALADADEEKVILDLLGESFEPIQKVDVEYLLDENGEPLRDEAGNPMVNAYHYASAEHTFSSETYDMPNGCTATIVTATEIDIDGTEAFQEYMAYFIRDGILYTVKPYAIYDNTQSFPMNDYDCLTVLYEVLDLFE